MQRLQKACIQIPWIVISLLITALVYWGIHCLLKPRSALFFVHIPKTGGTAFTIWLEQQHQQGNCLNIRTSHTHYIDSAMAVRMGYRPLVIIREPTERFLSSFYYWKYGSADIKSWQRNHDWKKAEHSPNAETFIQILKDPTHTQHQKLRTAITQQDNYTYRHHFTTKRMAKHSKQKYSDCMLPHHSLHSHYKPLSHNQKAMPDRLNTIPQSNTHHTKIRKAPPQHNNG